MLFSAGAVRGAQDLLLKQVVWVVISLLAGLYASMVNLEWLRNRSVIIFACACLGFFCCWCRELGLR